MGRGGAGRDGEGELGVRGQRVGVEAHPGVEGDAAAGPALDGGHHDAGHGGREVEVLQRAAAALPGGHGGQHAHHASAVRVRALLGPQQPQEGLQLLGPQRQGAQVLQEAQQGVGALAAERGGLRQDLQQGAHQPRLHRHRPAGQRAPAHARQPLRHQQLQVPGGQLREPLQQQEKGLVVADPQGPSVGMMPLDCLRGGGRGEREGMRETLEDTQGPVFVIYGKWSKWNIHSVY